MFWFGMGQKATMYVVFMFASKLHIYTYFIPCPNLQPLPPPLILKKSPRVVVFYYPFDFGLPL